MVETLKVNSDKYIEFSANSTNRDPKFEVGDNGRISK